MEALRYGEMRVHLKGGNSYVCPELNKNNVVRLHGADILRIEHYKPPRAAVAAQPKPKPQPKKSKATLLGALLKDNKISAIELIKWIEKCRSLEDLGIVMKDETRATVKAAYKERINELT